jgi:hypothetical protein
VTFVLLRAFVAAFENEQADDEWIVTGLFCFRTAVTS